MSAAHQTTGHACANPHCNREAQHGHLACRGCWYSLPKEIRDAIWTTWRAQSMAAHRRRVAEARDFWATQRFRALVQLRRDGASMSEAQFQQHLADEPDFRAWCEREGVPT